MAKKKLAEQEPGAVPAKRVSGSTFQLARGRVNIQVWLEPDEMALVDEAVATLNDRSRTWLAKNLILDGVKKMVAAARRKK